jgi:hypothetical protein
MLIKFRIWDFLNFEQSQSLYSIICHVPQILKWSEIGTVCWSFDHSELLFNEKQPGL